MCGRNTILDVLFEHGAELSVADQHQACPMHYAAQLIKINAITTTNSSVDNEKPNSLQCEVQPPPFDVRILQKLLSYKVQLQVKDKDGRSPLIWAASAGMIKIFKMNPNTLRC